MQRVIATTVNPNFATTTIILSKKYTLFRVHMTYIEIYVFVFVFLFLEPS